MNVNQELGPEESFRRALDGYRELRRARPDEISAFGEYLKKVRADGALSAKTKELMSLAISLATHCTPCVIWHTKMSLDQGATRDELLETALVAIAMDGGLAYTQAVYMLEAMDAWGHDREQSDEKA